jgi:LysM repeat protein
MGRWVALIVGATALSACANTATEPVDGAGDLGSTTTATTTTTTTEVEARTFYTVRRGDTLVRIANRFDIDLNALVEENGIADPTKIYVGQQLLIPPPPDEDEGPLLTIAPPTDPDLPPILPSIKFLDDSEPSG